MKIFSNLKSGDKIYLAEVKDSSFVGKIVQKEIAATKTYMGTGYIEITFIDGSHIITHLYEDCHTKFSPEDTYIDPMNVSVYATEYEKCFSEFKKIVDKRLRKINEIASMANKEIPKISLIATSARNIERELNKTNKVVLEPIMAD